MEALILKLKTLLPAEKFIVTGSYALFKYGLTPQANVKDLDIILSKPEPTAVNNMVNLSNDFPAKTKPQKKSSVNYIFMVDNIKVDVFTESQYTEDTLSINGVFYSSVAHIISAKKTYGRMKDWLQLRDMARMFFKEEEFQSFLNNSWQQSLNNSY